MVNIYNTAHFRFSTVVLYLFAHQGCRPLLLFSIGFKKGIEGRAASKRQVKQLRDCAVAGVRRSGVHGLQQEFAGQSRLR